MSVQYRGKVFADRWPYEKTVEANNYHVAAARIMTAWEMRFKGQKRPASITIKIVREN